MLVSLVLFLEPQGEVEIPADLGRAVHAWFLGRVREDDPPLAERLHEGHALRPFTLSPLRGARGGPRWLRITTLEPGLAEWLLRITWPGEIELGPVSFRVQGVTSEPQEHPWAGRTTYEALLDRLLRTEEPEARPRRPPSEAGDITCLCLCRGWCSAAIGRSGTPLRRCACRKRC